MRIDIILMDYKKNFFHNWESYNW